MSGVFEAFTRKYRKQSAHCNQVDTSRTDSTQNSFTAADFESLNSIRLLVFVESDSRRLIYDSQSVLSNDPNFRLADEAANSDVGINIQSDRLNVHKGTSASVSGSSLPVRHGFSFLEPRSGSKASPSLRRKFSSRSNNDPNKSKSTRQPVIKYQSDTKLLGEMIFGTMSMVYHGVTLKIHPNVGSDSRRPHTMISYLSQFNLEVLHKQVKTRGESFADLEHDLYGDAGLGTGRSLDCLDGSQPKTEMLTSLPSSLANLFIHDDLWSRRNNSGTSSRPGLATPDAASMYSGTGGGRANSTIFRSKAADSMSSVSSVSKQLWQTSIPAFYTASHDLSDLNISSSGAKRSRSKLGIALTFPSSIPAVDELIQTHIAIIEGYLMHVKTQVEFGMAEKENFFDFVNATYLEVKQNILRLFFDQRTAPSTWLNINSGCVPTSAVSVFMTSLSRFGSREMSFLSGVVTEVLCRHLSWINTVYWDEEQAEVDQSLASRTVVNKRWAQLCDLFGIASSPAKCYKIVICGKIHNSVRKYADVLSYFIRVASLNKRYVRMPSIQAILETTSSNENDVRANQMTPNASDWAFSDDVTLSRQDTTTEVNDQSNAPENFVCVELVDGKKLNQDQRDESLRTRQDSLRLVTDFGVPLSQNEIETGSSISTVKHEFTTSKSHTGSAVTPGSRDSKDRKSSSAKGSSNVSPPFLGDRSETREPHLLSVVSPISKEKTAATPADDAKKQSMAFVEEWMQHSANVSISISDLPHSQAGPSNLDENGSAVTAPSQSFKMTPLSLENPNETGKPEKEPDPLQDSGFSDKLDGTSTREQESANQDSEKQETDCEIPSDGLSATQRNLKGYTIVPLVDGQALCAPEVFPCTAPSSCLAHSLIGMQSSKYSQDAMLQTCNDPGQALLEAMHDSNRNFIVESKPCVLVIDIDKQKLYVCENGSQYAPPMNCSKTITDTLSHALALRRLGLKDHFCVSMIERSLHVLVCQSLALSHKLLQHPDPAKILESLAIHSSDLHLLKSIASAVKTMQSND